MPDSKILYIARDGSCFAGVTAPEAFAAPLSEKRLVSTESALEDFSATLVAELPPAILPVDDQPLVENAPEEMSFQTGFDLYVPQWGRWAMTLAEFKSRYLDEGARAVARAIAAKPHEEGSRLITKDGWLPACALDSKRVNRAGVSVRLVEVADVERDKYAIRFDVYYDFRRGQSSDSEVKLNGND